MFRKILCPTDFSEGSRQAVRVAARLANDAKAELVLVHAWYVAPIAFSSEAPYPPSLIQNMVDDAQLQLDAAVRDAQAAGASTTGQLIAGSPWNAIVSVLEGQAFDLCVIGTHGRTGLSHILLGSVAEKVIRHAPCSMLAVRPDSAVSSFKHALVPTDFSESAHYALDLAAKLVALDGTVTLLHVLEVPVAFSGVIETPGFAQTLDGSAAAALETAATHVKATRHVTTRSRIGYPGAQTLAEIDGDETVDLVAMGSHGRTGIKRLLLGSVAEKVARHARCPVLIARNPR